MDIVDEPGSIAILSAILAAKSIGIKDIGLNHSREYGEGTLRICFYDEDSRKTAADVLRKHNYTLSK